MYGGDYQGRNPFGETRRYRNHLLMSNFARDEAALAGQCLRGSIKLQLPNPLQISSVMYMTLLHGMNLQHEVMELWKC